MIGYRLTTGLCAAVGAFGLILGPTSSAQAFPEDTVTIVVPFPPGGIADQLGRIVAPSLERVWDGTTVVVENRPGAAGAVGKAYVANATPDGHTILITTTAMSVIPAADAVRGDEPLVQVEDFAPLARMTADPIIFVVRGDSDWHTLDEFVEEAKERPGQLSYASSGVYGPIHIPAEMLNHAAGIELNHVPYQGGGPMITALLGGEVDQTYGGPGTLAPHIEEGTFRPLAHTGDQPVALFPDVPSARELGYDMEYYLWGGVFTSAQVPDEILAELEEALQAVSEDPQFLADMENVGVPVQYLNAEEFAEFLQADVENIAEAVNRIGHIEE